MWLSPLVFTYKGCHLIVELETLDNFIFILNVGVASDNIVGNVGLNPVAYFNKGDSSILLSTYIGEVVSNKRHRQV